MPAIPDAPLLEAIFEMRWGQQNQNTFEYSSDEHSLFPGKLSAFASEIGFGHVERLNDHRPPQAAVPPQQVSHRFRKGPAQWPCFQLGLGVFTVNQNNDGYSWAGLKSAIADGISIFNKAKSKDFTRLPESLKFILRYQDVFYPADEGLTDNQFIEEHFKLDLALPDDFLDQKYLETSKHDIKLNFSLGAPSVDGKVTIFVASVAINGKPALLMETLVEGREKSCTVDTLNETDVIAWCERAHDIQKHAFRTLIVPSAYRK
jgi:uncharacterized protein (TIGR04255 family)